MRLSHVRAAERVEVGGHEDGVEEDETYEKLLEERVPHQAEDKAGEARAAARPGGA